MEIDKDNEIIEISNIINKRLNKGRSEDDPEYGFILLTYKFAQTPISLVYVSNTQPEGVIKILRHQADVLESQGESKKIEE